MTSDAPAAVFWIGGSSPTEAALWRHLRTLNMVLIPKDHDTPDQSAPPEGEESHEAMMFRHADGNVLAEVTPVLDAAQFSRVFGPGQALMFLAPDRRGPDGSALRRAVLPVPAVVAPAGMLALSAEQYAELTNNRICKNRRFTMDYLRDAAPEETAQLSDERLYQLVSRAEKSGFRIGPESDYAHELWAFMLLAFGESIASHAMITNAIRQPVVQPAQPGIHAPETLKAAGGNFSGRSGFTPIATELSDGALLHILADHLGTPKEMFDAKCEIVWAADHHVRGAVRTVRTHGALTFKPSHEPQPAELHCPWRFFGQYDYFETCLYCILHRHCDPLTAKYARPDPIGLAGGAWPQWHVDRPTVVLMFGSGIWQTRTAAPASRQLRLGIQFRSPTEDPKMSRLL